MKRRIGFLLCACGVAQAAVFCSPFKGADSNADGGGASSDAGADAVSSCAAVLVYESFDNVAAFPPLPRTTNASAGGVVGFEGTDVFSPPGSLKASAKITSIEVQNANLLWTHQFDASTTHLSYMVKLTEFESGAHTEYGCSLIYYGTAAVRTDISLVRYKTGALAAAATTFFADGGSSVNQGNLLAAAPLGWCKVAVDAVVSAGGVTTVMTVTAVDGGPSGTVSLPASALGETTELHLSCGVHFTYGAPATMTVDVDDVLLCSGP